MSDQNYKGFCHLAMFRSIQYYRYVWTKTKKEAISLLDTTNYNLSNYGYTTNEEKKDGIWAKTDSWVLPLQDRNRLMPEREFKDLIDQLKGAYK